VLTDKCGAGFVLAFVLKKGEHGSSPHSMAPWAAPRLSSDFPSLFEEHRAGLGCAGGCRSRLLWLLFFSLWGYKDSWAE